MILHFSSDDDLNIYLVLKREFTKTLESELLRRQGKQAEDLVILTRLRRVRTLYLLTVSREELKLESRV